MIASLVIKSIEALDMSQLKQIRERVLISFLINSRQHLLDFATPRNAPCSASGASRVANWPSVSPLRPGETED
jgi:hypothetical protein